ncbi:uncharacterized protein FFNC_15704 [Fusarium fujikuroi]|nr:uncharacterized protein FFNC_15704 [Fusarium fujikuroi]
MPDNAPNRGDDDDAVSLDDGYSEEEDLLIIGLAVKTLESRFIEELRVTKVQFYQLAD